MTFVEHAAIAAMQSLIIANPTDSPSTIASMAVIYAKMLDGKVKTDAPCSPKDIVLWYGGEQINARDLKISDLEFGIRVQGALTKVNVHSVADLLMMSELEFMNTPGLGVRLRRQVTDFMEEHNLKFHHSLF